MKVIEQYFHVVLSCGMLYKVALAFEFLDETHGVTIQIKAEKVSTKCKTLFEIASLMSNTDETKRTE